MNQTLACPECGRTSLVIDHKSCCCAACDACFPVTRGIIDLRNADVDRSAGFDIDADLDLAARMDFAFDDVATFNGLLATYEALRDRTDDRAAIVTRDHPMSAEDLGHGPAILSKIPLYLDGTGLPSLGDGIALEDGAGVGVHIPGFAARFRHVFVVDLSLAYLLLARKIMDERGITNVTLICASVERLPFAADSFDFIHSTNVIEHVSNQPALFAEARRVLKTTGLFFLLSPNRFSLYFEPHFGLPGYGFFPPPLRRWIVRRRFNRDADEVSLRSLGEVRSMARQQFDHVRVSFIPRRLRSTATGGRLRGLLTSALNSPAGGLLDFTINRAALGVMPYHALVCAKGNVEPHACGTNSTT